MEKETMVESAKAFIDCTIRVNIKTIVELTDKEDKTTIEHIKLSIATEQILTSASMGCAIGVITQNEYNEIEKCVYMDEK